MKQLLVGFQVKMEYFGGGAGEVVWWIKAFTTLVEKFGFQHPPEVTYTHLNFNSRESSILFRPPLA